MKTRILRKLLNDTKYTISNHEKYIAVGSPLCHNLINVDKETLTVKYALDTFSEGRKAIRSPELEFIWDKLHELIANGEINSIISENDTIENPLPVFYYKDGAVIETVTDAYGWPNTTIDGQMMYENSHFPTHEQARQDGIKDCEAYIRMLNEQIEEKSKEIKDRQSKLQKQTEYLNALTTLTEKQSK